jgi:hypothetical protein
MRVIVTCCSFVFRENALHVLVETIKNGHVSFSLPRAEFRNHFSSLEAVAAHKVLSLTNQNLMSVHQVRSEIQRCSFSEQSRDAHIGQNDFLEILFLGILPHNFQIQSSVNMSHDELTHKLFPLANLSNLSQSCVKDIQLSWELLKRKSKFDASVFDFLPQEFSLSELQKLFESISGKLVDVRNFRKKIEALDILAPSQNKPRGMAYRPPRLFVFNRNHYETKIFEEGEVRLF